MPYLIPNMMTVRVRRWKWLPWPKVIKEVPILSEEAKDKLRRQAIDASLKAFKKLQESKTDEANQG